MEGREFDWAVARHADGFNRLNRCGRNCLSTFKGKKKKDMPKCDQEDIKFVRFLANLLHSGRMRNKWIHGQSKEKFALQMVRQEKHFADEDGKELLMKHVWPYDLLGMPSEYIKNRLCLHP